MKFLVLLVALLAVIPLTQLLRTNPHLMPKAWFAVGLLAFLSTATPFLGMALITWPAWSGHTKGVEINATELLSLAIFLASPRSASRFPFKWIFLAYFLVVLLGVAVSVNPIAGVFYIWQLVRIAFLAVVVHRGSQSEDNAFALVRGLAVGMVIEAGFVLYQRVGLGIVQTPGTFGHQNFLGMSTQFVTMPLAMLLLARPGKTSEYLGLLAALVVISITASRATVGLASIGLLLSVVGSLSRGFTARKIRIVVAGTIALALLVPVAIASFQGRSETNPFDSATEERRAMAAAAFRMVEDHPFGVGANLFVMVANTQGYYEAAGVTPTWGSRSAPVHNIYLLTMSETGYLGLILLVILMLRIILFAIVTGLRDRSTPRGDLVFGLGLSLLIVSIHSYFEWIALHGVIQTFIAIATGMIAGLSRELKSRRKR